MKKNRRKMTKEMVVSGVRESVGNAFRLHWTLMLAVVCIVLVAGGVVEATSLLSRTPHFRMTVVEVFGAQRMDIAEVADACGLVPEMMNTLTLDLGEVAETCSLDPRIESAIVKRILPDTVRVTIREVDPRLLLATETGYMVFDSVGNPIPALPADWEPDLPILTGFETALKPVILPDPLDDSPGRLRERKAEQDRQNRDKLEMVGRRVREALLLVASMESMDPSWLDEGVLVAFRGESGYELMAPGRPTLVMGKDNFSEKLNRLGVAMKAASLRGAELEKVRLNNEKNPGSILIKVRKNESEDSDRSVFTRNVEIR